GDDFKDGYKVEFYNDTQIIEYTGEDLDKLKETNRITNGVCVAMEPDHAISISGHYQRKKRKFL
uniref:hypothetical protein n=1 Tax=Bacillus cereus group sp. BfR-BA-01353 TaxID=2920316 RepID=UPI001F5A9D40